MKTYTFVQVDELVDYCQGMIVATSHQDPLSNFGDIAEIELDLRNQSIKGSIFFDMLACTGDNTERFLKLTFDGEKFDLKSVEFIYLKKNSIVRNVSLKVFKECAYRLNDTILNSNQIELLRHGVAI